MNTSEAIIQDLNTKKSYINGSNHQKLKRHQLERFWIIFFLSMIVNRFKETDVN